MTQAASPSSTADDLSQMLRMYFEQGYVVVRGLYSSQEVSAIREAFMEQSQDGPVPGLSDMPKQVSPGDPLSFYPRMMNPHKHPDKTVGRVALEYLLDKRLEPLLEAMFGEEPLAAQTMFYFKPPGARGQELHQDNFYLRVAPGTCVAAWLAVDDVDAQNGGMKLVPETQQLEIACPEEADLRTSFTADYVPVPAGKTAIHANMRAGDVLFFNGSVIHGSTPNTSKDRFRRSLIAHYVPRSSEEVSSWYRPLLSFGMSEVVVAEALGGGPCGTVAVAPH